MNALFFSFPKVCEVNLKKKIDFFFIDRIDFSLKAGEERVGWYNRSTEVTNKKLTRPFTETLCYEIKSKSRSGADVKHSVTVLSRKRLRYIKLGRLVKIITRH